MIELCFQDFFHKCISCDKNVMLCYDKLEYVSITYFAFTVVPEEETHKTNQQIEGPMIEHVLSSILSQVHKF